MPYILQWNKESANNSSCTNVSARNVTQHHCNEVIDFQDTSSLDQSIFSTSLNSLQTERNNISKYKYQKGQRLNSDSYLSLLVLIFCRHALKLLRLLLPKQTRDSMHSCAVLSRRPHHSISNGARLLSWLLPIVSYNIWHCGLAPNSGGGLSLHAVTHL